MPCTKGEESHGSKQQKRKKTATHIGFQKHLVTIDVDIAFFV